METYYKAINWNEIEDAIDKSTWEKLTEQFWLDTRIPLSNDLDDWRKLSAEEKDLVGKVFGGLTLLDTMQSQTGVEAIRADVRTPHEEAVLNNIQFMESVHGTYIGYKFQLGFNELPEEEQESFREWMYDLLYQLYENEELYTKSLYDAVGWTEEVMTFLRYNANKALMNLGQDPLFPDSANDVNPIVMNGISTGTSNHDFFSQVGNGYLLGTVEAMQDDDYNYGL